MTTRVTLHELAAATAGTVVGDGSVAIRAVAPIESAGEGEITFIANPKYLSHLQESRASAIIVAPGVEAPGRNLLVCRNPYLAFAQVLTFLQGGRPAPRGVLPGACVDPGAEVGEDVTVHPGCIVGDRVRVGRGTILYPGVVLYEDVVIGEECTLHAGVVMREGCRLGNRVIVQASAVIGSDGFGFAPDGGRYFKIPQVGIVVVEDDVEIGSGTCIDRAALGVTRIGRGTKIDNLVQIAHNVKIGEDTIIVAQVGVAGSAKIGRHCTFGGQAAVVGHVTVGDNVTIAGRGGVTKDVDSNQMLSGVPAMPHKEWLRASMIFPKLPEMRKEIQGLKKQVEELELKLKEM